MGFTKSFRQKGFVSWCQVNFVLTRTFNISIDEVNSGGLLVVLLLTTCDFLESIFNFLNCMFRREHFLLILT